MPQKTPPKLPASRPVKVNRANAELAITRRAGGLTLRALEALRSIMQDPGAPAAARVSAANAILDRALGRPRQSVDQTVTLELGAAHVEALRDLARMRTPELDSLPDPRIINGTAQRIETEPHKDKQEKRHKTEKQPERFVTDIGGDIREIGTSFDTPSLRDEYRETLPAMRKTRRE